MKKKQLSFQSFVSNIIQIKNTNHDAHKEHLLTKYAWYS
jgi:hypothetical protein